MNDHPEPRQASASRVTEQVLNLSGKSVNLKISSPVGDLEQWECCSLSLKQLPSNSALSILLRYRKVAFFVLFCFVLFCFCRPVRYSDDFSVCSISETGECGFYKLVSQLSFLITSIQEIVLFCFVLFFLAQ